MMVNDTRPAAGGGRYAELIESALRTEGGHLHIGHADATLYFGEARLSGCLVEVIKREAVAAGLPVIDSRTAPLEAVVRLAVAGPMAAVARPPCPEPWHTLSFVPLRVIAEAYRAVGAEVLNMPVCEAAAD